MPAAKTYLVISIIVILADGLQSRPEVQWFDSITMRLCHGQHIHITVIIDDHNPSDPDVVKDELFEKILGSMSSVIVKMDAKGIQLKESDFGVVSKLSTSLLFIFYTEYSGDNVQIYRVMHSMKKVADFAVNYLLIILRTSSNFDERIEEILQDAWSKSILNIVIVEIRLEDPKFFDLKDRKCKGARGKIYTNDSNQVIVHLLNPFINKTYHEKFSAGMDLFPDFTKNMHGYPLNVLVFQRPPFSNVEWDENNNVKTISGPNIVLMQILSEKFNFSPIIAPKLGDDRFRLVNSTVEDLVERFKTFKVDISAHVSLRSLDDVMEDSMRSRNIVKMELGVLMPRKYGIDGKIIKNAFESGALTLVIIMITWFAVILLKFDHKIWQLCSILCLTFSIVVPHKPSRTYERILFLFVAMLGFMYSNDLYASLTNFGVDHLVEDKYETFDEIHDSGLNLIVCGSKMKKTFMDSVGAGLNMEEKILAASRSACHQISTMHRNVGYVLYSGHADELFQQWIHSNNGPFPFRFAEPILWSDDGALYFRQDLPGKKHMNQIIDRWDETGLLGKWYSKWIDSSRRTTQANDNAVLRDEMLKSNLLEQLIVVVVFGHSLATLAFIGELLTHRYGNPCKRKGKINLWSVRWRKTT